MADLTLAEAAKQKAEAEDRCSHPEDWVSRGESRYTADACWSCIVDVVMGDADEGSPGG